MCPSQAKDVQTGQDLGYGEVADLGRSESGLRLEGIFRPYDEVPRDDQINACEKLNSYPMRRRHG